MPTAPTEMLQPDTAGIARAVALLRAGAAVAFPTETVYGLGADATSDAAVAGVFLAKGRPRFNPLIAHVADAGAAGRLVTLDDRSRRLADAFWPGALTLVAPLRDDAGVSGLVTAGLPTLAVRIPAHPVAQALLAAFGGPVAAPSANPSGRISPTQAAHVVEGLGGRIAAILDGGACEVGLESTIVAMDGPHARLLRPGGIPIEAIEAVLGQPMTPALAGAAPQAPGMLASHYAPAAALRMQAHVPMPDEVWIGFGQQCPGATLSLSPEGNLTEAAAALYLTLRAADALAGPDGRIAIAPVPDMGLGRAINDRLRRAAAPRP